MKKILDETRWALREYCHEDGCENIESCPQRCPCDKKLDLDTAIAWKAAEQMTTLLWDIEDEDERGIFNARLVLTALLEIVSWHDKQYPELYNHLSRVVSGFYES